MRRPLLLSTIFLMLLLSAPTAQAATVTMTVEPLEQYNDVSPGSSGSCMFFANVTVETIIPQTITIVLLASSSLGSAVSISPPTQFHQPQTVAVYNYHVQVKQRIGVEPNGTIDNITVWGDWSTLYGAGEDIPPQVVRVIILNSQENDPDSSEPMVNVDDSSAPTNPLVNPVLLLGVGGIVAVSAGVWLWRKRDAEN